MADRPTPPATADRNNPDLDEPLPNANDPGGAHRKGYSADPGPAPAVPEQDPVPLADDGQVRGHAQKRDEDAVLPPTGRAEPGDNTDNDRLIGADR
jgi:hypothetical protein